MTAHGYFVEDSFDNKGFAWSVTVVVRENVIGEPGSNSDLIICVPFCTNAREICMNICLHSNAMYFLTRRDVYILQTLIADNLREREL